MLRTSINLPWKISHSRMACTHSPHQALTHHSDTADLNADGLVDATEAHDFAQDKTVKHTGGLQVPRAEYHIVGREAIYLSGDPERRKNAEHA